MGEGGSRKIVVKFERGGEFIIALRDDLAPRNCEEIVRALPLEGRAEHGIHSGQCICVEVRNFPVAEENLHDYDIAPGSLTVECFPAGIFQTSQYTAFIVTYGSQFRFGVPAMSARCPLSVVGRVLSLEGLEAVGRRLRIQGSEVARFERF